MELIEKRLDEAGFKFLGSEKSVERLILDILDERNMRYIKAIPFLIYKYDVDVLTIYSRTKRQRLFEEVLDITRRLFMEFGIRKQIPTHIQFIMSNSLGTSINYAGIGHLPINYAEFRDEFEIQMRGEKKPFLLIDRQKIDEERNLQYWMSQLFSKKEKEIMKRILEEKPLSRTEYEYYSRKIKKKLKGIVDLQDFARSLSEKKPQVNEELFLLKKSLEHFIEIKFSVENISIKKYSRIWEDSVYIEFDRKGISGIENQPDNRILKLTEFDDKKIISLLEKYKEAEFV